jgi:hypothetical protein
MPITRWPPRAGPQATRGLELREALLADDLGERH